MNAKDQARVRATIAHLLAADDDYTFGIDVWADRFKNWGAEKLPTGYVRSLSQTPFDGHPTWPERDAPGQRVAAAATLRGVFLIEDFRADHKQVAQDRTGMVLPPELSMRFAEQVISARRMGSDLAWRRGFVTAGARAWQEASGKPVGRSRLGQDGKHQHGHTPGFTFEKFLLDVWAETGIATTPPITFAGVGSLAASD